jgi:hypothetical protein
MAIFPNDSLQTPIRRSNMHQQEKYDVVTGLIGGKEGI